MKNCISPLITALFLSTIAVANSAESQTGIGSVATDYSKLKPMMTAFINNKMSNQNIPGLAIAVIDGQRIIWSQAFGLADGENKINMDINTQFRAGSITKVFTAIAILQLVEQGKLDLDKSLKTYLPQFKINSRHGNTDNITIRSVLSHTSGLPSDYVMGMWQDSIQTSETPYTELVDLIHSEYVSYPPYTAFSYSNVGLTLLGHVVHNVSGMSYQNYVRQNILHPLKMHRSDIEQTISGDNFALSYHPKSNTPVQELALRDLPAGGLNSVVEDLAHLIMMVNANGEFSGQQILQENTLHSMFIKPEMLKLHSPTAHGLGWMVDNSGLVLGKDQIIVGHDGATIGHTSQLKVAPKSKLGVVVLGNTSGAGIYGIADFALKQAYAIKTKQTATKVTNQYINCSIIDNDNISGSYIVPEIGLATIKKIRGKWIAEAFDIRMKLKQQTNGLYRFSYKWLGLFPTDLGELNDIGLCFKQSANKTHILIYYDGYLTGLAQKVFPRAISDAWNKRLGHYQMVETSKFMGATGSSTKIKLSIENGLLIFQNSNTSIKNVLLPINDQRAIVAGYGRSLGETVRVQINAGKEELISSGIKLIKSTN